MPPAAALAVKQATVPPQVAEQFVTFHGCAAPTPTVAAGARSGPLHISCIGIRHRQRTPFFQVLETKRVQIMRRAS